MKLLIVEDEIPAQQKVVRLINKYYPEFDIIKITDSIEESVKYLKNEMPNLIFMDVELSDGNCFEIFNIVDIKVPVIITTAYENYALDAFKVKCIDYLLKPIEDIQFKNCVERCLSMCLIEDKTQTSHNDKSKKKYKQRFTVKLGNQILVIDIGDIACFYAEDKSTFLITNDSKQFLTDSSLENIEIDLDPSCFFKISRNCIAGLNSIKNISKYFNSRLKVTLSPQQISPVIVPRSRVANFLEWLEGSK